MARSSKAAGARGRSGRPRGAKRSPPGKGGLRAGLFSGLADKSMPCRVPACSGTWTWTVDEQVRALGQPEPEGLCTEHLAAELGLSEQHVPCKVHGCTRTFRVGVEAQLRHRDAQQGSDNPTALPKGMCDVCREFCRVHPDVEMPCANPGCGRTWTYKTGAQLQAFIAGNLDRPQRFCRKCRREEARATGQEPRTDSETMPCVVPGCTGAWTYRRGMKLAPASEGSLPPDRMCSDCRQQHPREKG